jgi:hypothetical protein
VMAVTRVARWYIFKPKTPIWVNFRGTCNRRCWYIFMAIWSILQPFDIFWGHLVYFMVIWCILWSFGVFYGHLVCFFLFWYVVPRKIWQPWLYRRLKQLHMYSVRSGTASAIFRVVRKQQGDQMSL